MEIFNQILEMDDDEDDHEFSKSIVYNFFQQAEKTFVEMQTAMYVQSLSGHCVTCLICPNFAVHQ